VAGNLAAEAAPLDSMRALVLERAVEKVALPSKFNASAERCGRLGRLEA
jgi:hypothetical protein